MRHLDSAGLGRMGGRISGRPMGPGRSAAGPNRTVSNAEQVVRTGRSRADRPHPVAGGSEVLFTLAATALAAVLPPQDPKNASRRSTAPLISRDSGISLAVAIPAGKSVTHA
jgi:3-hydroxyisobutyrate dehydrogenase-like beta-hydroxyacid dehydrogenase